MILLDVVGHSMSVCKDVAISTSLSPSSSVVTYLLHLPCLTMANSLIYNLRSLGLNLITFVTSFRGSIMVYVHRFFSPTLVVPLNWTILASRSNLELFPQILFIKSSLDCILKIVRVVPHDLHSKIVMVKALHKKPNELPFYSHIISILSVEGISRQGQESFSQ